MKRLRMFLMIIISIILILLFGNNVNSFPGDGELWINPAWTGGSGAIYFNITENTPTHHDNVYCIKQGYSLMTRSGTHPYCYCLSATAKMYGDGITLQKFDKYGNCTKSITRKRVEEDYILAAILCHGSDLGMWRDTSAANTSSQSALFEYWNTWVNASGSGYFPTGGGSGGGSANYASVAESMAYDVTIELYEPESSGYQNIIIVHRSGYDYRVPPTIDIGVSKSWDDSNNAYGNRPSSINLDVYNSSGSYITSTTLSGSGNTWYKTIYDLPSDSYYVRESSITGYSSPSYSGTQVTNSLLRTSVKVTKKWDDDSNRDGKRPGSIKVILYANGTAFSSATLQSSGSWSHTFTNLPQYINGNKVTYTVDEESVPTEYTKSGPSGSASGGFTITNSHTPERTNVKVTKIWNDINDVEKIRPSSITVTLCKNGTAMSGKTVTLSDANNWTYTFENEYKYESGKLIKYSVTESGVPSNYTFSLTENSTYDLVVTNTYIPKVEVTAKKTWDDDSNRDGKRPSSLEVTLYKDGAEYQKQQLSSSNNWTYTFKDLLKYTDEGKRITYTVKEANVPEYNSTESSSGNTFSFINKHEPERISVSVDKVWDDDDDRDALRPKSVIINLYANGTYQQSATLSESNNWSYTFENLFRYSGGKIIDYTVSEDTVAKYDKPAYSRNEDSQGNISWTVTNKHTPYTRNIIIKKQWKGDEGREENRPQSLEIYLYANGRYQETVNLTGSSWSKTITVFLNDKGKEINYTVEEPVIPERYIGGEVTGDMVNGFTVTNTYMPGYIEITGIVWNDGAQGKETSINGKYDSNTDTVLAGVKVRLMDANGDPIKSTYYNGHRGDSNFKLYGTEYVETTSDGKYTIRVNYDTRYNVYKLYEEVKQLENKLKEAHIEFEYDGIKYTTVANSTSDSNTSKATEDESLRNNIDTKYARINSTPTTVPTDTIIARTEKLKAYGWGTLESEETIKICNGNGKYTQTNDKNLYETPITGYYTCSNCPKTIHALTNVEIEIQTIKNINLGLFEREQPDVAIFSDLTKVEVIMNSQKYTYLYGVRTSETEEDAKKSYEQAYQYAINNGMSHEEAEEYAKQLELQVKFQNKDTYTYKRPVNPADIAYVDVVDNTAMQVYVTYEVKVANLSTTLPVTVHSIINSFDKEYDLQTDGWSDSVEISGFKQATNENLNITVDPQKESSAIELKYKVSVDAIRGLLREEATLNNAVEITSYSTKYGASTVYAEQRTGGRTGNDYAGYDYDSHPGNAGIFINSQGRLEAAKPEDDTDIAPSFVLVKDPEGSKTLAGTVWEDSDPTDPEETTKYNERIGNGYIDGSEHKIRNVKVELFNLDGTRANLYGYDESNQKVKITDAVVETNDIGEYSLNGVVTGEYFIRYTYGNNDTVDTTYYKKNEAGESQEWTEKEKENKTDIIGVFDKNGNPFYTNARNFKSTIIEDETIRTIMDKKYSNFSEEDKKWPINHTDNYSVAVDNMLDRLSIEDLKNENYYTGENMTAYTKPFSTNIEFINNESSQVKTDVENRKEENGEVIIAGGIGTADKLDTLDFGIIERPREALIVQKDISYFKITLANGQVLAEGNPKDENANINYTKLMGFNQNIKTLKEAANAIEKRILVEIDAELIQNAQIEMTYEVSVANNSEVDYDYGIKENYYSELNETIKLGEDQCDKYIAKSKPLANYYYYGEGKNLLKPIKATFEFVDYIDDNLVHNVDEEQWQATTSRELRTNGFIEKTVEGIVENQYKAYRKRIVELGSEDVPLTITMQAKKVLANQDDNAFDNNVEIILIDAKTARTIKGKYINEDGKPEAIEYIPGNYAPGLSEGEVDDDSVDVMVTPPTGETKNATTYIITVLVSLVTIAVTIIFIKKKILIK